MSSKEKSSGKDRESSNPNKGVASYRQFMKQKGETSENFAELIQVVRQLIVEVGGLKMWLASFDYDYNHQVTSFHVTDKSNAEFESNEIKSKLKKVASLLVEFGIGTKNEMNDSARIFKSLSPSISAESLRKPGFEDILDGSLGDLSWHQNANTPSSSKSSSKASSKKTVIGTKRSNPSSENTSPSAKTPADPSLAKFLAIVTKVIAKKRGNSADVVELPSSEEEIDEMSVLVAEAQAIVSKCLNKKDGSGDGNKKRKNTE